MPKYDPNQPPPQVDLPWGCVLIAIAVGIIVLIFAK